MCNLPFLIQPEQLNETEWAGGGWAHRVLDEIIETPPLPRKMKEEAAASGPETGPTEEQKIFETWLAAFGNLPVRDKAEFGRGLAAWFRRNVREI
jgi:hypothetical protein